LPAKNVAILSQFKIKHTNNPNKAALVAESFRHKKPPIKAACQFLHSLDLIAIAFTPIN